MPGGSSHDGRNVVNNLGDRFCPLKGVVGPLINGHSWLLNGGDPNHLLTGMTLQVGRSSGGWIIPRRVHVSGDH